MLEIECQEIFKPTEKSDAARKLARELYGKKFVNRKVWITRKHSRFKILMYSMFAMFNVWITLQSQARVDRKDTRNWRNKQKGT